MTIELPEPMRCPECRATPDARICATHGLYLLDAAAMAQLDQAPLLGQVLDDKYALIGLLGGGGYGSVYRGLQQPLGREVAVKVLHGLALTMKVARERFEREAQALSCLTSVHTVRLIDYGITREGQLGVRNLPYMVMELVEGEDLERVLRRGPLSPMPPPQRARRRAPDRRERPKRGLDYAMAARGTAELSPSRRRCAETPGRLSGAAR